jgi:hypothetical protein
VADNIKEVQQWHEAEASSRSMHIKDVAIVVTIRGEVLQETIILPEKLAQIGTAEAISIIATSA